MTSSEICELAEDLEVVRYLCHARRFIEPLVLDGDGHPRGKLAPEGWLPLRATVEPVNRARDLEVCEMRELEAFTAACDRCVVTTIDPQTCLAGKEPLRTLALHRRWSHKTWFGIA